MSRPVVVPCPVCGYHAPELSCPSCGLDPHEQTLKPWKRRIGSEVWDGLRALPQGARALLATRGTKRLLVPPLILTASVFGVVFYYVWRWITEFFDAVKAQDFSELGLKPGFWLDALEWLGQLQVVLAIAHWGAILVLLAAFTLAGLWTFSVAYELISGPFLDTIQARVEKRWFGADPRLLLEEPPGPDPARSANASMIAVTISGTAIVAAFWIQPSWSWWLMATAPIAFVVANRLVPGTIAWTLWFAGTQVRALWTSIKASALAALFLVAFIWLKFVPIVGIVLFAMVAGFATALTLLDIPFSRRGWSVSQRLTFLGQHLPGVLALGIATSFVFIVPVFGPLIGVPCASLGGQWLLCRFDKNKMRPPGRRIPFVDPQPPSATT